MRLGLLSCALLLPHLCGCGARAMQRHLTTARASHSAIESAAEAIEEVCTVEALRAAADPETFGDRCEIAVTSQHLLVELWSDYVEAVVVDGLDAPTAIRLGRRIALTYSSLRAWISSVGGPTLPKVP